LPLDERSRPDAKDPRQVRARSAASSRTCITTVYVTHDQEEALSLSDRVAVMRGA